ncbi:MAG: nucleotidyltransferase domain-containing protein, partial [Calditrichaeota bacterium]
MRKIYHVLQPFVEELRERLIEFYGENLAAAIVFGSYARGEVRFASDLDILIILNECSLRRRERQREFEREVEERLRYEPN